MSLSSTVDGEELSFLDERVSDCGDMSELSCSRHQAEGIRRVMSLPGAHDKVVIATYQLSFCVSGAI